MLALAEIIKVLGSWFRKPVAISNLLGRKLTHLYRRAKFVLKG